MIVKGLTKLPLGTHTKVTLDGKVSSHVQELHIHFDPQYVVYGEMTQLKAVKLPPEEGLTIGRYMFLDPPQHIYTKVFVKDIRMADGRVEVELVSCPDFKREPETIEYTEKEQLVCDCPIRLAEPGPHHRMSCPLFCIGELKNKC